MYENEEVFDPECRPEEMTDAGGQWQYLLEDGAATLTGYVKEPAGDLVIPDELDGYPVTSIGWHAFEDLENLTSVIIPESVIFIDYAAFSDWSGLTSVTIPDSVASIDGNPFVGCPLANIGVSPGNQAYMV